MASTVPNSPASRTRSKTVVRAESPDIAELEAPVAKKKKTTNNTGSLSDFDVWKWDDNTIIDEATKSWTSKIYDFFDITLTRNYKANKEPISLEFVFTCKYDPVHHQPHARLRSKTSVGTTNLKRGVNACLSRRNMRDGANPKKGAQKTMHQALSNYSPEKHRAVIALRCASSKRPFNMVQDLYYVKEIQMLRPGTVIPHPTTVSQDILHIYKESAKQVLDYFKNRNGAIHLAIDGWTAPIVALFLGIVIIWPADGQIYRAILEFVHLKQSHTGQYLAEVTSDCLKQFGLDKMLHTVCMDNASNCDTMVKELQYLLPSFCGKKLRLRCIAHIINLIAKAYINFFFMKPHVTKTVTFKKSTSKKQNRTALEAVVPPTETTVLVEGDKINEADLDEQERQTREIAADVLLDDTEHASNELEEGQIAHDDAVVKSVMQDAIARCRNDGITIPTYQLKMAQGIFPKVAGLARHVHDSTTLLEKFDAIVAAEPSLSTGRKRLARHMATRWNSELECLQSHVELQSAVEQLTAPAQNKLRQYALDEDQWRLATQLVNILVVFEEPTKLFSRAQVPLVHEMVPILERLENCMLDVYEQKYYSEVAVTCVAAKAALIVIGKYYALSDDSEVPRISMIMCPDKKLKWFIDRQWQQDDINAARELVIQRFEDSYKKEQTPVSPVSTPTLSTMPQHKSRYLAASYGFGIQTSSSDNYPNDSIQRYLADPIIQYDAIQEAGGYMAYWEKARARRPQLAQMAIDFLSAPASSVDAERVFSGGRLMVNHLQHNMTSNTFRAQIAVSSWSGTPLLPTISNVAELIKSRKKKSKEKAATRAEDFSDDPDVTYSID